MSAYDSDSDCEIGSGYSLSFEHAPPQADGNSICYVEDINENGAKSQPKTKLIDWLHREIMDCNNEFFKTKPNIHECLRGPVKPYVEFDLVMEKSQFKNGEFKKMNRQIGAEIRHILQQFYKCKPADIMILCASGIYDETRCKFSFHGIVNGCGYYSCGRVFKDHVLPQLRQVLNKYPFDAQPYGRADRQQNLRAPYCSKFNSSRKLKLCTFDEMGNLTGYHDKIDLETFEKCLVQCTKNEKFIALEPLAKVEIEYPEDKRQLDESSLNKILAGIDVTRFRDYWKWTCMITSIRKAAAGADFGINSALTWSLGDPQYEHKKDSVLDKIEEIFENEDLQRRAWGVGHLMRELKNDNLDLHELMATEVGEKNSKGGGAAFLFSQFTDGDVADYFMQLHGDEFKFLEGKIFHFQGSYWQESSVGTIFKLLDDIYWDLDRILGNIKRGFDSKKIIEITKNLEKLRSARCLKNFWEMIKTRIEIQEYIFDKDPYLLGFMNGTYDLKAGLFRGPRKEDYISRVVPYDYSAEVDPSAAAELHEFISKVLPILDEREFLLKVLSTTLDGMLLENMIMLLGDGRNGKDTLMNLLKAAIGGGFFYKAPNYILTEKIKPGPNPEVASMHLKRAIIYSEPDRKATLRTNTIKELTGSETMSARQIYSKNVDDKKCSGTHIVLLNNLLSMDDPGDAMLNRLLVIRFHSLFRTEEHLALVPEGTPHVYLADAYYKTDAFYAKNRMPFMHLLLRYYKKFAAEGHLLKNVPRSIMDATREYVADSDDFVGWFRERYEFTNSEADFARITDIYKEFKNSDLWNNMNRTDRRKMTKVKLEQSIKSNPTLRPFFKDRLHTKNVDVTCVLVKYKMRKFASIDEMDDI